MKCKKVLFAFGIVLPLIHYWFTHPTASPKPKKTPVKWEFAFNQPFASARPFAGGLAAVSTGGKYGYIDTQGVLVIMPMYDSADDFSEGLAQVTLDNKRGYINYEGKVVADTRFAYGSPFSEGKAVVTVADEAKAFIDKNGQPLFGRQFPFATTFSEGVAAVDTSTGLGKGRKFSLIDETGKVVLETTYQVTDEFSDGLARVLIGQTQISSEADVLNLPQPVYGFIDHTGRLVFEARYDNVCAKFVEGLCQVLVNHRWGYINTSGVMVIPPRFEEALNFSEGLALVRDKGKYGYIYIDGRYLITPRFQYAKDFAHGMAAVCYDNKFGYIDSSGKFVIEPQFDSAESFSDGLALVSLNGHASYIRMLNRRYWH